MSPCAAPCRCSQSRSCKYALLLTSGSVFEPEGESGAISERRVGAKRPRGFESLPARHTFQVVSDFFKFGFISRGRIGPFGVAEFGKRQVGFFISHCVCVDAKCQRRISVTQLICNPTDVATGV